MQHSVASVALCRSVLIRTKCTAYVFSNH